MSSTNTAWKSHSLACEEINTPSTHSLLVMVPNYQTVHVPTVQSSLHRNDARDAVSMQNYLNLRFFSNIVFFFCDWSRFPASNCFVYLDRCQFKEIAFLCRHPDKRMPTIFKYLTAFGCHVQSLWELIVAKTYMSHRVNHNLLPKWQWSFIIPIVHISLII